ncbi:MAG: efflux RND transporter periplasmic adaptor subunit [Bacteroidales bacterium]|nr:efflux RND transporter periplasmic adaptor subunit [Bacteroidales bacterium]
MKKLLLNKYIHFCLFAFGGLFIGWLFFHTSRKVEEKHELTVQDGKTTIWTCAMHPQIRRDAAGKCPICGMDLIPLNQNVADVDPNAIHLTKEAAQLANVLTSVVTRQQPVKEVRLYGKIQADERLLQSQVAQIPGRIEKLLVNFTGETVKKGQTLALIYSPELVTAQQELLEAAKTKQTEPEIYEAAKEKLRLWKLTETQITAIENSASVQTKFDVVSTMSGIVTSRRVNNGDYVSQGTVLYDLVDLSTLWVMFDAYESDLPFLKTGDNLDFTVQAIPGETYSGKIIFIDPVVDPVTRVSKVRVEINNRSGKLKPEMFATGIVQANLTEFKDKLVIPRSAVLWTGKRSIVYVKQPGTNEPVFKIREIGLGPMLGSSYIVTDGLAEGEEIVTQGTFSVDAAAQLEGKPSMMNPIGGKVSSMPGMNMPGDNKTSDSKGASEKGKSTDAKTKDAKSMPGMNMPADKKPDDKQDHSPVQKQASIANTGQSRKQLVQNEMFTVSGNCEMCKDRIEKAAKSVNGVKSAIWDIKTNKIQVEFDPGKTDLSEIQRTIAKAGHDTGKFKADDKIYARLPACCHYRAKDEGRKTKEIIINQLILKIMKTKSMMLVVGLLFFSMTTIFANEAKTEKIKVYGNCGMCKSRIEEAAKSVKGVTKAKWDDADAMLTVTFDDTKTSVTKIEEAVSKVGHDTDHTKTADKTYDALPGCCKYERPVNK